MADTNGAAAVLFDQVDTPAQDVRLGLSALLANGTTRSLGARTGRRSGTAGLPTVSGLTVTIPPNSAVADPAYTNTQGPYLVSWKQAQTVVLDPAPGSNSRVDIVYVRVFEQIFDAQGNGAALVFGKVTGTPSSNPQPPTVLADGTTPISRVTVLAYVTVPASGASTIVPGPAVVAAGGIAACDNAAAYPANVEDGTTVWDKALRSFVVRDTGAWRKQYTGPTPTFQIGVATVTTSVNGTGSVGFPVGFAAVPVVVATPASSGGGFASVQIGTRTTAGFDYRARNNVGGLMNGDITFTWIAAVPPA